MNFKASLKEHNSFGVDSRAFELVQIQSIEQLLETFSSLKRVSTPHLFLGGGSNVLFTRDFEGIVIKNQIRGIQVLEESDEHVLVEAGAGETWHDFVEWSLNQGFCGLENLALIPGSVGAAPIQNIGAYGVEVKDFIEKVEGYDLDGNLKIFQAHECEFGYRESLFKKELLDQFMITKVVFKLHKKPQLKLSYGKIQEELEALKIAQPSSRDVADVVIKIRRSKLPDPQDIGNAGSFFKNPVIEMDLFHELKSDHPNLPHYPVDETLVKVPAGWLIEQSGWKGHVKGDAGVHAQQALVLVNHGEATGLEIHELSKQIQEKVHKDFKVSLTPEVRIL